MHKTYFISDVHLSPENPLHLEHLLTFMDQVQKHTQALYILGDLTDRWLGDDQDLSWLRPLFEAANAWHQAGIPIYFMLGNHDALVGAVFFEKTHMIKIPDPYCITLEGHRVLLSHGDRWVKRISYRCYRFLLHQPWIKQAILALPLTWRTVCLKPSKPKHRHTTNHQPNLFLTGLYKHVVTHQADAVIHGHFHQPQNKTCTYQETSGPHKSYQHIILGPWGQHQKTQVAVMDHQGLSVLPWPLATMPV